MIPKKLKVVFGFFPYAGNGACAAEHPDIRNWLIPNVIQINQDERIQPIGWVKGQDYFDIADTPLTMTRNDVVYSAKEVGADVLVMIDSDNTPDVMLSIGDPTAKPFFKSSFDYLYQHYERGPTMIGAPYCGPPMSVQGVGTENVYVFLWRNYDSTDPEHAMKLDQYTREEAAARAGIEPVAALPTGCIMIDLRCFDYLPPNYFEYEWEGDGPPCEACGQHKPGKRRKKASTEDVTITRDIAINVQNKLGYNPVLCNWDAWAGHWKPRCVGKPRVITVDAVGPALRNAVEGGVRSDVKTRFIPKNEKAPKVPIPQYLLDRAKMAELPMPSGHFPSGATTVLHPDDPAWAEVSDADLQKNIDEVHNTQGADLDFLKAIVHAEGVRIMPENRKLIVVELGSWVGHSAIAMAQALQRDYCTDFTIYCVDNFLGGNEVQRQAAKGDAAWLAFQKNTAGYRIEVCRGDTVEIGKLWDGPKIDVLYVDADHSYEGCKADIETWFPHVADGGVIVGHDYNCLFDGVKRAVHEIFGWDGRVYTENSVWVTRKNLPQYNPPHLIQPRPEDIQTNGEVSA